MIMASGEIKYDPKVQVLGVFLVKSKCWVRTHVEILGLHQRLGNRCTGLDIVCTINSKIVIIPARVEYVNLLELE